MRHGPNIRDAVADVTLSADDLILPLFVTDADTPQPVASMPGVQQWPVRDAVELIGQLIQNGLHQFILFGVTPPDKKDANPASAPLQAPSPDGPALAKAAIQKKLIDSGALPSDIAKKLTDDDTDATS